MNTKPKTESMCRAADCQLRRCTLPRHAGHQPRAMFWREAIHGISGGGSFADEAKALPYCSKNCPRDYWRDAVTNHPERMPYGRMKHILIRKALKARRLPNCDYPRFARMDGP